MPRQDRSQLPLELEPDRRPLILGRDLSKVSTATSSLPSDIRSDDLLSLSSWPRYESSAAAATYRAYPHLLAHPCSQQCLPQAIIVDQPKVLDPSKLAMEARYPDMDFSSLDCLSHDISLGTLLQHFIGTSTAPSTIPEPAL